MLEETCFGATCASGIGAAAAGGCAGTGISMGAAGAFAVRSSRTEGNSAILLSASSMSTRYPPAPTNLSVGCFVRDECCSSSAAAAVLRATPPSDMAQIRRRKEILGFIWIHPCEIEVRCNSDGSHYCSKQATLVRIRYSQPFGTTGIGGCIRQLRPQGDPS